MATRKTFLAGIAAGGAAITAPAGAVADATATNPAVVPTPKATSTPKAPSAAASAWAARMRAFDASLSEKELTDISTAIDQIYDLGGAINPKGRRLKNSDEPSPPFGVEP